MSNRFNDLVAIVLRHEGGYVNDPKDPGGETNFGISKKAFPKEDIKGMTRERAIAIYERQYWNAARCSEIPEDLQPIYFDTAVNAGVVTAIRLLQIAAGIEADGIFGEKTARAAFGVKRAAYAFERLAYYERLIKKNPALAKFRKGWTKRVNSFLK